MEKKIENREMNIELNNKVESVLKTDSFAKTNKVARVFLTKEMFEDLQKLEEKLEKSKSDILRTATNNVLVKNVENYKTEKVREKANYKYKKPKTLKEETDSKVNVKYLVTQLQFELLNKLCEERNETKNNFVRDELINILKKELNVSVDQKNEFRKYTVKKEK